MFSVLASGPGRYRLQDGTGADVGWIRAGVIGFRGFHTEAEAITAASVGWRALQSWLRGVRPTWPRQSVDWDALRFVHDGAHEWISDGRIPLARLYRGTPRVAVPLDETAPESAEPRGLAIEFVVPSWTDEGAVIPIARTLRHVIAPLVRRPPATAFATSPISHRRVTDHVDDDHASRHHYSHR